MKTLRDLVKQTKIKEENLVGEVDDAKAAARKEKEKAAEVCREGAYSLNVEASTVIAVLVRELSVSRKSSQGLVKDRKRPSKMSSPTFFRGFESHRCD